MPDYEVGFVPFPEIEGGKGRFWISGVGSAFYISVQSRAPGRSGGASSTTSSRRMSVERGSVRRASSSRSQVDTEPHRDRPALPVDPRHAPDRR